MKDKMFYQLMEIDKACADRVKRVWKEMLETTKCDQGKKFTSLEEYVDFRIVDTGAP